MMEFSFVNCLAVIGASSIVLVVLYTIFSALSAYEDVKRRLSSLEYHKELLQERVDELRKKAQ
jgi:UDP-N-acetylmuramate-alanine ligase